MYRISGLEGMAPVADDVWATISGKEFMGGKIFTDPSMAGVLVAGEYFTMPTTSEAAAVEAARTMAAQLVNYGAKNVTSEIGADDSIFVARLTYNYTPTKWIYRQLFDTEEEAAASALKMKAKLGAAGVRVTDHFVDNDLGRWGYNLTVDPVTIFAAADKEAPVRGAPTPEKAAALPTTALTRAQKIGLGVGLGVTGLFVVIGIGALIARSRSGEE